MTTSTTNTPATQLMIIKRSPFECNDLDLCLQYANNSAILLMQDGVYAACGEHLWSKKLSQIQPLYVLKDDLSARGLSATIGNPIDYDQFVQLTEQYPQIQSW